VIVEECLTIITSGVPGVNKALAVISFGNANHLFS
jgi:hypothetical protein